MLLYNVREYRSFILGNSYCRLYTSNFMFLSGILNKDGSINNPESIRRLAEVSLAYAKAGMQMSPANMAILSWNLPISGLTKGCHTLANFSLMAKKP